MAVARGEARGVDDGMPRPRPRTMRGEPFVRCVVLALHRGLPVVVGEGWDEDALTNIMGAGADGRGAGAAAARVDPASRRGPLPFAGRSAPRAPTFGPLEAPPKTTALRGMSPLTGAGSCGAVVGTLTPETAVGVTDAAEDRREPGWTCKGTVKCGDGFAATEDCRREFALKTGAAAGWLSLGSARVITGEPRCRACEPSLVVTSALRRRWDGRLATTEGRPSTKGAATGGAATAAVAAAEISCAARSWNAASSRFIAVNSRLTSAWLMSGGGGGTEDDTRDGR
jgi:hypothetical protein